LNYVSAWSSLKYVIIELVTKEFRLLVDKKETSHRLACLLKLVLIQDPNVKNGTSHKRAIHTLIHP
jgi:hypothetical protein